MPFLAEFMENGVICMAGDFNNIFYYINKA